MKKPLILVDGSAYLYRAYHALPPLMGPHGQPTGAVYGVVSMLKKLLAEETPTHMAVIFDGKGKNFRHALYADYKAHRPPMPEELVVQIEPLHAIVKAMGIPLIVAEGVEADDIIGTLARQAQTQGESVLISTSDKDMAQLVNERVTLVNTMTRTYLTREKVKEKFGVWPEQVVDYLALMGDASDNVPGVPGVGPKTAAKWLNQYESLESLIANADAIGGKVGQALRDHLSQLPLCKQLVTIDCQHAMQLTFADLCLQPEDQSALQHWYAFLGFKSWLVQSPPSIAAPTVSPSVAADNTEYVCVQEESELRAWAERVRAAGTVVVDTETTSIHPRAARIVGLSLALGPGEACYIPFGHQDGKQLPESTVKAVIKPLLEDENIKKIGQHMKYDQIVCWNWGVDLRGVVYDTMLESYALSSISNKHDLDTLASVYCNHTMITFEDVAGKGKAQKTFDYVDLKTATVYAAEDADYTWRVHEEMWPLLQQKPGPCFIFESIEMPLSRVLAKMEYHGVLVDEGLLRAQSISLAEQLTVLQEKIFKSSGELFNVDSPKQLQWILFDKLGLPVLEKTPTGQPSTAESVLQALALNYELPSLILEYRSLNKLKSTYTDKLPLQINVETGRIHTSYHQAVTATGRLSSSEPNLQNIPVRTQAGRDIRKAFIAPPGRKIVAIDYSQIELRIMAHLSQDEGLCGAFAKDLDIHSATAAEVFGVPLEAVSHEARRRAKAINFGLIYGMSAFGLAKQIGSSREEAQHYIDLYFKRYPGVKQYMANTRSFASTYGYVETLWGRRLDLPNIHSKNVPLRMAAERVAINAPMQGTAADIIKKAMIAIDDFLVSSGVDATMIMQVHDELVFEVGGDVVEIAKQLALTMEHAVSLSVPMKVQVGIGSNWDEAH